MPIAIGTVDLEYKVLPLTMQPDGSAVVTLRKGYDDENGQFVGIGDVTHSFTPEEVSAVLDVPPEPGLTRRDDLSLAIYQMLVNKGVVSGAIS